MRASWLYHNSSGISASGSRYKGSRSVDSFRHRADCGPSGRDNRRHPAETIDDTELWSQNTKCKHAVQLYRVDAEYKIVSLQSDKYHNSSTGESVEPSGWGFYKSDTFWTEFGGKFLVVQAFRDHLWSVWQSQLFSPDLDWGLDKQSAIISGRHFTLYHNKSPHNQM